MSQLELIGAVPHGNGSDWLPITGALGPALDVVDGLGRWVGCGAHYSRRSAGSPTFTGVGQEVVLITRDLSAVWAVVLAQVPAPVNSGTSRGRSIEGPIRPQLWRNMLFRNLGDGLSSELIKTATAKTYEVWLERYGALPDLRLRTEVDIGKIKSSNPGYCYQMAGWSKDRIVRGKLYLNAPDRNPPMESAGFSGAS